MTVDTTTYGDPAQVRAAAEWLDPGLKNAADGLSLGTTLISTGVRSHWAGESADEYVSILLRVGDAADEVLPQARDAAEKFRSYARQLERMRETFARHRQKARSEGLPVTGQVIGRPVTLVPVCPTSRDDPYCDEWQVYQGQVELYNPSSSAVNIVGGVLGGVAATAAVGALAAAGIVTLPVWGTAVVVAGVGVAVGAGAVWAYENWVPQDVRESIDAGMEQAWDATADFAEDAWENTGEFFGDAGHEMGKAWKSVFG